MINKSQSLKTEKFLMPLVSVLLVGALFPNSIAAENVFSWKDENGNIIYGSKPPKGVKRKSVSSKTYSTYSSKKLLKGLGKEQSSLVSTPTSSEPIVSEEAKRQELIENQLKDPTDTTTEDPKLQKKVNKTLDSKPEINLSARNLTDKLINIKQSASRAKKVFRGETLFHKLSLLEVALENKSPSAVRDLEVGFATDSGEFLRAEGPSSIASNQESIFTMDVEENPLMLPVEGDKSQLVVIIRPKAE